MKSVKRLTSLVTAFIMTTALVISGGTANAKVFAGTNESDKSSATVSQVNSQERKVIGYFPEWAFADPAHENYTADRIPWGSITHLNYAFAVVNAKTNKIDFGDKEAAIEKEFPGQTSDFSYKGHFNVINSHKKKYPNVKSLISVGGWVGSQGFYTMAETDAGREAFANSCVDFIRTYGFDGVDIDYEYPTATSEAGNPLDQAIAQPRRAHLYDDYCKLMKTLREKLDAASKTDGKKYLLTAALPASSWILGGMGIGMYAQYLDYANLMTYDFHGAWNGYVGPQSALYPDERDNETKGFPMPVLNIDWAYRYFRGVLPAEKINIGIPYYTRGWKDVQKGTAPGGLYGTAAKTGGGATGIDNIWHDKDDNGNEEPAGSNPLWHANNLLKNKDYQYFWDDVTKTPYIWNEGKKVFLTFEDERSIKAKLDYTIENNLGGVMIWELDGDYDVDANGDYVVGDTLTNYMSDYYKKAGPLVIDEDKPDLPPSMNYNVTFTGKYDHPNYDYTIGIKNNTNEEIKPGWTFSFDLPKSCYVYSMESVTIQKKEDIGDFTRYTVTGPGWSSITPGSTFNINGTIKLCFSGGPRNFTLNGYSSEGEYGYVAPTEKYLPVKPTLTSDELDSKDGTYNLTLKVAENTRADYYTVYEGDTPVAKGKITDTKAITKTIAINNRPKGIYDYKVVLKNKYGIVSSDILKVNVTRTDGGGVLLPPIGVDFKITKSWGTSAEFSITLTNKGVKEIKSWELEFDLLGTISSGWNCQFKNLGNNRYNFKNDQWSAVTIKPGASYTFTGACLSDCSGEEPYNISAKLVYTDGTTSEDTNQPVVLLPPTVKTSANESTDGNYNITVGIPANSNGTSYKLYENGAVVKEGTITSVAQDIVYNVTSKVIGNYEYKAVITDGKTNAESTAVSVTVKKVEDPTVLATPSIKTSVTASKDGNYEITAVIPANSNGTLYAIYENSVKVKEGAVTTQGGNFIYSVKDKATGNYDYKVVLSNDKENKESATIKVAVDRSVIISGLDVKFQVTSDWGSGANWSMVITNNTGKDINSWSVEFESPFKIIGTWDGVFQALSGNKYKISNPSWGGYIKNGASITIGGSSVGNINGQTIFNVVTSYN